MKICLPLLLSLGLTVPALAFSHAETGLEINLAAPYAVTLTQADPQQGSYVFSINRNGAAGEKLTGEVCALVLRGADSKAKSQSEINNSNRLPSAITAMRASYSSYLNVGSVTAMEHGDIVGLEIIGQSTKEPKDLWLVVSALETPAGLTLLSCTAYQDEWPDALELFRTIRQSVTPPA